EFQLPFDISAMETNLNSEYVLLVHLHPYMKAKSNFGDNNFIYHIKEGFSIQELLVSADILITDYSTVFFDFSLLHRPIIFYAYDLEDYKAQRDFYYDYENLVPGPIVANTNTLISVINNNDFRSDIEMFAKRF